MKTVIELKTGFPRHRLVFVDRPLGPGDFGLVEECLAEFGAELNRILTPRGGLIDIVGVIGIKSTREIWPDCTFHLPWGLELYDQSGRLAGQLWFSDSRCFPSSLPEIRVSER